MALGCVAKCVFTLLNVLFLLVSLACIAMGSILAFVPGTIFEYILKAVKASAQLSGQITVPETADDLVNMPMIHEVGLALFVFGIILFAISFLGCCGSCCVCCKLMLILFAIIMVVLMIGEIVVITMFLVRDSPLHDNIRSTLKDKIKTDFNQTNTDSFSQTINLINHYFDCCGIDGVADFDGKDYFFSCYNFNNNQTNTIGCYTKLNNIVQDNIVYAGLAFAGLLVFQLVEIILAVVIFKTNKISPL